jgi:TonB family protein
MNIRKLINTMGVVLLTIPLSVSAIQLSFFSKNPSSNNSLTKQRETPPTSGTDKIVKEPDIDPMFTGGTAAMHKFITSTLNYPKEAIEKNIEGLVVYTFVVEKDGTLSNFNLIHRADPMLDAEALRILKAMPPWRPAKYKGEAVRAETYVPMYFKINKNRRTAKTNSQGSSTAKTDLNIIANEEIFSIVDQMPQYPGGEKKLTEFLSNRIIYPSQALQNGIEGRILCSFIVAKDGTVSNIEVLQSPDPELSDEAVRVLSMMPKWNPGINNGEKVNVKCVLPIDFKINEAPIPPTTTNN